MNGKGSPAAATCIQKYLTSITGRHLEYRWLHCVTPPDPCRARRTSTCKLDSQVARVIYNTLYTPVSTRFSVAMATRASSSAIKEACQVNNAILLIDVNDVGEISFLCRCYTIVKKPPIQAKIAQQQYLGQYIGLTCIYTTERRAI